MTPFRSEQPPPPPEAYRQSEKEAREPWHIPSRLENLEGQHADIRIARDSDGKPKALVFFDLDLTFLELEEVLYPEVRRRLWPNINPETVDKVHLAGFKLGTMFKEMYRMRMLNERQHEKWVDAKVYADEFLAKKGQHINEPGDPYHEVAAAELKRFDEVATQVAREVWQKHPESYERAKIGPLFQLAEEYRRLGVPMVAMTANPRGFITDILKCTRLADAFIECATDDDVPGDKEHKMKWLVEQVGMAGVPVPYDRLEVIGDSVTGDVGSGPRFEQLMAQEQPKLKVKTHGLLVVESAAALEAARTTLATKPELSQHLLGAERAQALRWDKVKTSPHGTFNMTQKYRKEFLEPLVEAE